MIRYKEIGQGHHVQIKLEIEKPGRTFHDILSYIIDVDPATLGIAAEEKFVAGDLKAAASEMLKDWQNGRRSWLKDIVYSGHHWILERGSLHIRGENLVGDW